MSTDAERLHAGKPYVMVEIGNDWLKLAHVVPMRRGVSIPHLHLEKIGSRRSAVAKSISAVLKSLKLTKLDVVGCLPRQMVNVRMLELPSVTPEEIRDMIDLQVGKQTPYSKKEIVHDYKVMSSESTGYSRAMLVIVQRTVLRERFNILEEAGIDVARMSVSTEGLFNWYAHSMPPGQNESALVLLDIDSFYSDLAVMAEGRLIFTRSILVGANHLLGEYDKWKDKFVREVSRSLEICQAESRNVDVGKVFLTGAGVNVRDLVGLLGERLRIQTETRDCLTSVKKMSRTPSLKDPNYQPVSLTPLVGMAIAPESLELNLVPDTVKLRKDVVRKARSMTTFGILIMTVMVAASMYANVKVGLTRNNLTNLKTELEILGPEGDRVERMRRIVTGIQARNEPRFSPYNLFYVIRLKTPDTIKFDSMDLDIDKKRVTLAGLGDTWQSIRTLIDNLEKTSVFVDVKEVSSATKDENSDKYKFQIVGSLEKQE
jgi:Tfp pilus assembly PilM family ATPase